MGFGLGGAPTWSSVAGWAPRAKAALAAVGTLVAVLATLTDGARDGDRAWILLGAAGIISLCMPRRRGARWADRLCGPAISLAMVLLVLFTGAADSPYRPLLLLLLLYASAFSRTGWLVATFVAVGVALSPLAGGSGPSRLLVVGLLTWAMAAGFVRALVKRLEQSAQTDGLTNLWDHAAFWRRLEAEHSRSQRSGTRYSVVMLDLDHFKDLNDQHGHRAGDEALRHVAGVLADRLRSSDLVARYGGEEFALLLPDTNVRAARSLAEELRRRVQTSPGPLPVTVSAGVADSAAASSADEVVSAADRALYRAKQEGRNRVHAAVPCAGCGSPQP